MTLKKNKLYFILFIACVTGYIWLYFSHSNYFAENKAFETCFIKHTTNIPCPSCGSTRAILSLTQGDFREALHINPMGFIVAVIMLFAPLWILADIMRKRRTLFVFYQKMEVCLKKPLYAIPLILLVIINWIWNIAKGL